VLGVFFLIVQSLRLGDNQLGDAAATAIASTLVGDGNHLESLYLGGNHIGDAGCTALARSLGWNTSLQHLELRGNPIGDSGIGEIARALSKNGSLQALDLCETKATDTAATTIAKSLKLNFSLNTLRLERCQLTAKTEAEFISALDENCIVTLISLPASVSGGNLEAALKKNTQASEDDVDRWTRHVKRTRAEQE